MSSSSTPDDTADVEPIEAVERALTAAFGEAPERASVSYLGVEPIEVLRFSGGGRVVYASLGMSRRPMTAPMASMVTEHDPRAEIVLHSRDDAPGLWRRLAVVAAAPAVEGVVHAVGATVDLGVPLVAGSRCVGGVFTASGLPSVVVGAIRVEVLRLVPATSAELAWARARGSAALRERWADHDIDLLDLRRKPVALG